MGFLYILIINLITKHFPEHQRKGIYVPVLRQLGEREGLAQLSN